MTGVLAGPAPACGGVQVRMRILVDQETQREESWPFASFLLPPFVFSSGPHLCCAVWSSK